MAIAVYFHTNGMTLEQFNAVHRRLEQLHPDESGRLHHSCFGDDGSLMVYDIWDSMESFEAFGEVLGPVLADLGVDAGQPSILTLHALQQREALIATW